MRRRCSDAAMPSHRSAASAPRIAPITAATTAVLRWLRAVMRCAAAPSRIFGVSTCVACSRSWAVLSSVSFERPEAELQHELVGRRETLLLCERLVDDRDLLLVVRDLPAEVRDLLVRERRRLRRSPLCASAFAAQTATRALRRLDAERDERRLAVLRDVPGDGLRRDAAADRARLRLALRRDRVERRSSRARCTRTVLGFVCAAWSWTLPLAEYGCPR